MSSGEQFTARIREAARLFEELVELPSAERARRLDELGDAELRRQVLVLLAADAQAADTALPGLDLAALDSLVSSPATAPAEAMQGQRIGAWRIVGRLGRGGMGDVFRAERADGQFTQQAALKLLRRGLDSEEIVGRFLRERQILAQLHHPKIAQLLDGGVAADGRPFFVMELVEGEAIHEACARRQLGLEARLRLVLEVIEAVGFAHRHLVVHRDIKPTNVFVTSDGSVKLLDFGIAKLLSADAPEPTRSDLRLFTPQYATPEQLAGGPVTTATDIYALGLLLYELLIGEPAFPARDGDSSVELEARRRENVARPSARVTTAGSPRAPLADDTAAARKTLARRLAGDLDAIVLKALRSEPELRYASVFALADDLERFLSGHPVGARGGARLYRLSRFVRRRRGAVAAALAIVAALVGGLVATARQAQIAAAERARAERRFADVRQLANRFLFEFEVSIRDLPGATPVRENVARTARDYLDRLAAEAGDDLELLDELAQAYLKVGDLEGHPRLPNLGQRSAARASYERGLGLGERMLALAPDSLAARERMFTADLRLGDLDLDADADAAAEAHYRRALATAEGLVERAPLRTGARRFYGQALQRLGSIHLGREQFAEAQALFARYRDSAAELAAADPEAREPSRDLLVATIYLGDGYDEGGQADEALAAYRQTLEIAERRRRQFPGAEAERDWSVALQRVLVGLRKVGLHAEALPLAQAGLAFAEGAAASDPANAQARRDLAESVADVGRAHAALGSWIAALPYFTRARELFEALRAAEPDSAEVREYLDQARELEASARAAVAAGSRGPAPSARP